MAAFKPDCSLQDVYVLEVKTAETRQHSSQNTDNSLVERYKLNASLTEKGIRYDCKECGKQMANQSSLNAHRRAVHEEIKYPCRQYQYKATSKESLAQHRRAVHEGIKYSCGQCQHEATSKGNLARHRRAFHLFPVT